MDTDDLVAKVNEAIIEIYGENPNSTSHAYFAYRDLAERLAKTGDVRQAVIDTVVSEANSVLVDLQDVDEDVKEDMDVDDFREFDPTEKNVSLWLDEVSRDSYASSEEIADVFGFDREPIEMHIRLD